MHRQTVEIEGYGQLTEIEISLQKVAEPALLTIIQYSRSCGHID